MKKKVFIKRTALILIFVTLLALVMWWLGYVLKIKRTDGVTTMQNLYAQEEDTCDVLLLGSSHVGMNLDAEVFWSEYGIPAYSLWGSVQPFWNSYYFMLEALKTQTPEVLVLDAYAATFPFEYSDDARQETNVVGMHLNSNKIKAIMASAPKERWLDMVLEYPLYHSRITELTEDDFLHFPWSEGLENDKGTGWRYGVGDYSVEDVTGITDAAPLHPKEEEYLRKIIETCQSNAIPLVLIKTPTIGRSEEQPQYNRVAEVANEYGVPFLNMNIMDGETGICAEDFWTDGHLNTNGARKVSSWLASYLVNNYNLTDHRGDSGYSSWDTFAADARESYIKEITGTADYFKELKRSDYSLIIVKNACGDTTDEFEQLLGDMGMLGISADTIRDSSGGTWSVTGAAAGACIAHPLVEGVSEFQLNGTVCKVGYQDDTGVQINGEKVCSLGKNSITVVVLDSAAARCLDVVSFAERDHFALTRP